MLTYILYTRIEGFPFVRTSNKIKVKEPLQSGTHFTYNQFHISRGYIDRCSFDSNEFRVFITL